MIEYALYKALAVVLGLFGCWVILGGLLLVWWAWHRYLGDQPK